MFDRPWDKSDTWDTSSEILQLFCTQSLNSFESCHLQSTQKKKKDLPFSLLYIKRMETDHLNHVWAVNKVCLQMGLCSFCRYSLNLFKGGGWLKNPSTWPRCNKAQQKPAPAQQGLNTPIIHGLLQSALALVLRQKSGTASNHKLNINFRCTGYT